MVKSPPTNAGVSRDGSSTPGSGRYPGVGNGNTLQYSCPENSMNREAWWATVNGITELDTIRHITPIYQQSSKTQQWPRDWKMSVFIPIPPKGNAKECSNYRTIALISYASKIMLKFFQVRTQHYVNRELPNVQSGF